MHIFSKINIFLGIVIIVMITSLIIFACKRISAEEIQWKDGKSAWQYSSYRNSIWSEAGKVCPNGYDELRTFCNENGLCTVVFRCQ